MKNSQQKKGENLERKSAFLKNKTTENYKISLPKTAFIQTKNLDENILKTLEKLDKLNKENQFWNIDWQSGQFLLQICKMKNAENILEIGTSTGFSTIWLASGNKNSQVTTIESSKKRYPMALEHFKEAGLENNINLLVGHAPEILNEVLDQKFDVVFIDCSKKYYLEIFKILENNLNIGGCIIADNMISHGIYMEEYFKYVKENPKFISTLIPIGAGMEISTKIA